MTNRMSAGWLAASARYGPPGVEVLVSGKVGDATTKPRRASAIARYDSPMFRSPKPWLLAMSGNGPPDASGASATGAAPAGPVAGYQICVGSVRDGRAGSPACAGASPLASPKASHPPPTPYR